MSSKMCNEFGTHLSGGDRVELHVDDHVVNGGLCVHGKRVERECK
jgi:hypothetical protein